MDEEESGVDEKVLDVDEETSEVDGEVIVDKMKVQCFKPPNPLEPGGEVKISGGPLKSGPPEPLRAVWVGAVKRVGGGETIGRAPLAVATKQLHPLLTLAVDVA